VETRFQGHELDMTCWNK